MLYIYPCRVLYSSSVWVYCHISDQGNARSLLSRYDKYNPTPCISIHTNRFIGIVRHQNFHTMRHKILNLKSLFTLAVCVAMSMAIISCSDNDDEPDSNDLAKILIGVWAQDGDNDILTINVGGTGTGYDNSSDYQNNRESYQLTWNYSDGWVNMTIDYDGDTQAEKMRARSVTQNKIVWQRYAIPSEGYDPSEDEWDGHDSFGYYDLWTWERYK